MPHKFIALGIIAILYGIGWLFLRNTHPYHGNPREPFESKQQRRRIGTFFLSAATMLLGIAWLVQFMISRN